jgi:hypothetical protein
MPLSGFQFTITGVTLPDGDAGSGGIAEDAGFQVMNNTSGVVLGFDIEAGEIPAGEGVLTNIAYSAVLNEACLTDEIFVLGTWAGGFYEISVGDCVALDCGEGNDADCTGECGGSVVEDCAGECGGSAVEDECGVCNGDGIAEGSCDCDGNVEDCAGECGGSAVADCAGDCGGDALEDCAGECGGSAVEDECGICGGDGSSCSSTIDILYDIDTPVAGFQFDIEGVEVLGASGGAAEDAGFSISISGNTVTGNSLTGSLIEPGSGILVQAQVNGNADPCLENIIFSDSNVSSENFESGFGSLSWDFSCTGFGCSNWDIDNTEFNTGAGSAKSGSINDGQSSDMSITLDIAVDGEIEFDYRVSAEYSPSGANFYDGLEFYIDNILKGQYQSTEAGGSPWTHVSHDVTEGEHTFRWSYVKDVGVTCNSFPKGVIGKTISSTHAASSHAVLSQSVAPPAPSFTYDHLNVCSPSETL